MTAELLLALIAGLVTILNPCVLPLVPILVASAIGRHRYGPVALALGIALSFTLFGFTIIAFGFQLGINEQAIRVGAGALLALAGLVLLVPALQARLSALVTPLTNRANAKLDRVDGAGLNGQFLVGLVLGLVWAPCVGPTLGAAIAAASQGEGLASAFVIFLTFSLGVMLSILGFAYGSRKALSKRAGALQTLSRIAKPLFGAMLLLIGLMVVTGIDKQVEALLIDLMPHWLIAFTTQF